MTYLKKKHDTVLTINFSRKKKFIFLVGKHRDPQSINAKLFLPIIPIGIICRVRFYSIVGQPLSKQLYKRSIKLPQGDDCLGYPRSYKLGIINFRFIKGSLIFLKYSVLVLRLR